MNKEIKNIFWQTCTKYLQNTIPIKNFIEYICPLETYIEENTLILLSPNNYIKEKIEKNYLSIIKNILQNISNENYKIKVIIGSIEQYKQKKINNDINKKYKLKNINDFIKSVVFMIIKNPGTLYNPIFIEESTKNNKSIIITFIINELINLNKTKNIKYTILKNDITNIELSIKNSNLLIIEELHLIKLNITSQKKIKNMLVSMIKNNIQIIITSNTSLKYLKNINDDTKKLILNGLIIKNDKNYKNDKNDKKISLDNIIKYTLLYYNADIEKIKNKTRNKSIVLIRQIIFYLCKSLTNKTFSEISLSFGNYTNANIIHSYKKIKKLIEKDFLIKTDIQNIKNSIVK